MFRFEKSSRAGQIIPEIGWRKACVTVALAVSGLQATPASAITNDWVKDNAHPYVGMAVFYDADDNFLWRCSGTLIGPKAFLTAGHCTDMAQGARSARVYFQQDAGAHYDPQKGIDPVSGYPSECAKGTHPVLCTTSNDIRSYGFKDFVGFPDTKDLGLLILKDSMVSLGQAQLPEPRTLDKLANSLSNQEVVFTVSGYGLSYSPQPESVLPPISLRERLMARSSLVNLGSALTGGYNLQTQGNGSGRGGTCSGDSGGPVFLGNESSRQIVAVTSFGLNALCRGTDFSYRLDRADVLDWIRQQLPKR